MLRLTGGLGVILAFLLGSAATFAHHSESGYDREKPITLTGTVAEFQFVNPHLKILIEVKGEDGVAETWEAEGGPPQIQIRRYRVNKNSLKPGDQVKVTGFPAKDGSKSMIIRGQGGVDTLLISKAE